MNSDGAQEGHFDDVEEMLAETQAATRLKEEGQEWCQQASKAEYTPLRKRKHDDDDDDVVDDTEESTVAQVEEEGYFCEPDTEAYESLIWEPFEQGAPADRLDCAAFNLRRVSFQDQPSHNKVALGSTSTPPSQQYSRIDSSNFDAIKRNHKVYYRRTWTLEEDKRLIEYIKANGAKDWGKAAKAVKTKTNNQCSQRWNKALDPSIKKGPWSMQEDRLLIELVQQYGYKWKRISKQVPGRTGKQCRDRYTGRLAPKTNPYKHQKCDPLSAATASVSPMMLHAHPYTSQFVS
jgi:hypothetical protein